MCVFYASTIYSEVSKKIVYSFVQFIPREIYLYHPLYPPPTYPFHSKFTLLLAVLFLTYNSPTNTLLVVSRLTRTSPLVVTFPPSPSPVSHTVPLKHSPNIPAPSSTPHGNVLSLGTSHALNKSPYVVRTSLNRFLQASLSGYGDIFD